jgi:hypothetical protein
MCFQDLFVFLRAKTSLHSLGAQKLRHLGFFPKMDLNSKHENHPGVMNTS